MNPTETPELPPCAEQSAASGEPLAGTAAHTRAWIIIEYARFWPARILEGGDLEDPARAALRAAMAAVPGARVQFIRRPSSRSERRCAVFLARSGPSGWVWRTEIDDHAELAEWPLERWLSGDAPPTDAPGARWTEPLVLVCTHGKRDVCCARTGPALFTALCEQLGGPSVWQTTHLGGHRYAPTLVSLPDGYCYGRVQLEDAPALSAGIRAGRLYDLTQVRGRSDLPAPAQRADLAVRAALGAHGVGDISVGEPAGDSEAGWAVDVRVGDGLHRAHVHPDGTVPVRGGCEKEVLTEAPIFRVAIESAPG